MTTSYRPPEAAVHTVLAFLAEEPLVHLFVTVAIGALLGSIQVGGIRLHAAAVLFVAIAVTALGVANGVTIEISTLVGDLGLALFAFAIGITSGPSFFHAVRTAWSRILVSALVLVVAGGVTAAGGRLLGLAPDTTAGTFAGALTNTPSLAAAGGTPGATVGYSVPYLFGVVGMLVVINMALAYRRSDTDAPSELFEQSVRVERDDRPTVEAITQRHGSDVRFNRIREGHGDAATQHVATNEDVLEQGMVVTVIGPREKVEAIVRELGHPSSLALPKDRRYLDFRRITVSDPKLAGREIRELNLERTYGATISRVRRGDVDIGGVGSTVLQRGDRVRVIAPASRMKQVSAFFGDSARGLTDINPVALGVGLSLGLVLGAIPIPLPGGSTFAVGSAAGALVVGLVMGRVGRVGRFVTALPHTAAMVLTELGLTLFLAYAGTRAGSQIAQAFTSGEWWRILVLGAVVTAFSGASAYVLMRFVLGLGGTRLSGVLAGMQTQPALLAYANGRTNHDPRVMLGYALVYPTAMIAKILTATVLAAL